MSNPFRYFNSSPEVIRLTVMMYIRYPLTGPAKPEALSEFKARYSDWASVLGFHQGPRST